MALYSFHGQIIGRGKSIPMNADGSTGAKEGSRRSTSVAAAAYRSGSRLVDARTGMAYDYTHKGGVIFTEIMLPENAPGRYHDRQTLWNAVESAERQTNSQLSRELRIALPSELSREQNISLVRQFAQGNFVSRGMIADIAYHAKDKQGEDHNPHVHIMLTMRPLTKGGAWWKTKSRKEYLTDRNGNRILNSNGEYKTRNIDLTGWNDKGLYVGWREAWAKLCNERYAELDMPYRIDHRSYAEQGVDRLPTRHMGKDATALEQKGVSTDKGEYNRTVAAYNEVAELGIEPTGLYTTLQSIFLKAKERQRLSRKARGTEPTQCPESDVSATDRAARGAASAGRNDQRRTDAPLHGAVRQGDPLHPKDESTPPFGAKKMPPKRHKTPTADAVGERSSAPASDALRNAQRIRSAIRHAEGTQNFLATRGAHSYDDVLIGCRRSRAEYDAAYIRQHSNLDRLRDMEKCVRWIDENGGNAKLFNGLKAQSSKFYNDNKEAINKYGYAVKQLEQAGYSSKIKPEAIRLEIHAISKQRNEFAANANKELSELRNLEKCARRCSEHREVAEQFQKLKLFRGRFYQNHKDAIDKFNYGKNTLQAAGFNEYFTPEAMQRRIGELGESVTKKQQQLNGRITALEKLEYFASKLPEYQLVIDRYAAAKQLADNFYLDNKQSIGRFLYAQSHLKELGCSVEAAPNAAEALKQNITAFAPELHRLEDELRMWCSCEAYVRKLHGIEEKPNDIPDFTKGEYRPELPKKEPPTAPERQHKQKAPERKPQRDSR